MQSAGTLVLMPTRPSRHQDLFSLGTVVLAVLFAVGTVVLLNQDLTDDALGNGIAMFASYGLVALAGGAVSGWRRIPVERIAIRWLAVGATTGVVITLFNWGSGIGTDPGEFVVELLLATVFISALIGGAAVIGSLPGRFVAGHTLV